MTNQQIVDAVDDALPSGLPPDIKERILNAIWDILNDHLGIDL